MLHFPEYDIECNQVEKLKEIYKAENLLENV